MFLGTQKHQKTPKITKKHTFYQKTHKSVLLHTTNCKVLRLSNYNYVHLREFRYTKHPKNDQNTVKSDIFSQYMAQINVYLCTFHQNTD